MCGLVGIVGTPTKTNRQIFQEMLCFSSKRGLDSVGVILASRKNSQVLKTLDYPWDFIKSPEWLETASENWPVMMGHNRAATVGDVSIENAHPFEAGDLLFMHNGTLVNDRKWDSWTNFETDSEVLANEVANRGIRPVWKELEGAATCIWWDKKQKSIFVITNGKRPFHFATSHDDRSLYYASESWMFERACDKRKIKLSKKFWHLPDHGFWKFTFKNNKIIGNGEIIDHYTKPTKSYGGSFYDSDRDSKVSKDPFSIKNYNKTPVHNDWSNPEEKDGQGHLGTTSFKSVNGKVTVIKGEGAPSCQSQNPHLDEDESCEHLTGKNYGTAGTLMGRSDFRNTYGLLNCSMCKHPKLNYDTAVIVDERSAICGICVADSSKVNVKYV